jgi:cellulose biosynthesis protein BcsQ
MKPVKIYTVVSGNGGSASSTTATNLAYWIDSNWTLENDDKILLASLDEQDDSTYMLAANSSSGMTKFLTQPMSDLRSLVLPSPYPNIEVLSSNRTISSAERAIAQMVADAEDKDEARAAYAALLRSAGDQYRAVIYDSAKHGELRHIAIMAAEHLIITTRMANHNMKNTLAIVGLAHKIMEPEATISILPVMLESSQKSSDDDELARLMYSISKMTGDRHINLHDGIPRSTHVDDAVEAGMPILAYAPHNATTVRGVRKSAVSKAYNRFFFQSIGV